MLAHGRAKLARKGCDLLVVNEVGWRHRRVRGHPTTPRSILGADGTETDGAVGTQGGPRRRVLGPRRRAPARRTRARRRLTARLVRPPGSAPGPRPPAVAPRRSTVSRRLFTSESVTEGHPDKIADQISDCDPRRAAHRGPAQPGRRRDADHDRPGARRRRGDDRGLRRHPGDRARADPRDRLRLVGQGLRRHSCGVSVSIGSQSPDIAQGVDDALRAPHGRRSRLR